LNTSSDGLNAAFNWAPGVLMCISIDLGLAASGVVGLCFFTTVASDPISPRRRAHHPRCDPLFEVEYTPPFKDPIGARGSDMGGDRAPFSGAPHTCSHCFKTNTTCLPRGPDIFLYGVGRAMVAQKGRPGPFRSGEFSVAKSHTGGKAWIVGNQRRSNRRRCGHGVFRGAP